ncbi:MAG TPA: hypothetical protein VMS65_06425 [Polyangiaceae bacterium]|nr:hypothetical protein [Polyangiaceae bacterium]
MNDSGFPGALLVAMLGVLPCVACGDDSAGGEPYRGGAGGMITGGTGGGGSPGDGVGGSAGTSPGDDSPYAREVISFEPGEGAGFGEGDLPDVVLGPPDGRGELSGSLDVLSLGKGGSIVLGFGENAIVDSEGGDFVVFENAFWPGGDPALVFAEPGEVSVSADGSEWHTFACDAEGDGMGRFEGCAGWTPALEYDPNASVPLDPARTGGDAFDLADVGLASARFVRVTDVSNAGSAPSAGFDLDAVGVVHVE